MKNIVPYFLSGCFLMYVAYYNAKIYTIVTSIAG